MITLYVVIRHQQMCYVRPISKGGFTIAMKILANKLVIVDATNGALNLLKLVKSAIATNLTYRKVNASLLQGKSFHIKCDILRL